MDPLSVTASVVGITATCVQTAKALSELRSRMSYAELTITSMCTETTIISASLSQIQSLVLSSPDRLTDRPDLTSTLDQTLTGCYLVFDVLQNEVLKFAGLIQPGILSASASPVLGGGGGGGGTGSTIGLADKLRLLWNENTMQEILSQIRGLQTALTLLLQLYGTHQMADLATTIEANTTVLAKIVEKTARFARARSVKAPESIFDMSFNTQSIHTRDRTSIYSETTFRFDDTVVNAQVYRRVLARAYGASGEPKDSSVVQSLGEKMALASIRDPLRSSVSQVIDEENEADGDPSGATITGRSTAPAPVADGLPVLVPARKDDLVEFLKGPPSHMLEDWEDRWSIAPEGVSGHSVGEIRYQRLLQRIIKSEVEYLHDLQTLRYFYKERLNLDASIVTTAFNKSDFPDARAIFHANRTLLLDPLTARQDSEGPWMSHCWDIFENWLSQSESFYLDFARAMPQVRQYIGEETCLNPSFVQFLNESAKRSQSLELVQDQRSKRKHWIKYTGAPIKRIMEYILLLHAVQMNLDQGDALYHRREPNLLTRVIGRLEILARTCDAIINAESGMVRGAFLRSQLSSDTRTEIPPEALVIEEGAMLWRESRFRSRTSVFVVVIEQPVERVIVLEPKSTNPVGLLLERKPLYPRFTFDGQIDVVLSTSRVGSASEGGGVDVYTLSIKSSNFSSSRANFGPVVDLRTTEREIIDRLRGALLQIGAKVEDRLPDKTAQTKDRAARISAYPST